jgi:uncharacterized protein YuzE
MNLNYDNKNDILYLAFADKSYSYGDEDDNGCVIMKDFGSDEITGVTIFDFMSKYNKNQLPFLNLPVQINYNDDIIPFLAKS